MENRFGNKIIYQLAPRTFTNEGTLSAAEKLLSHVKDEGFDVVYLTSIFTMDDGEDKTFWSERQRASSAQNPKNCYRVKDYYSIDEEFGNEEDLKSFIKTAHSLDLLVILDLVYFHCGPNAVFLKDNPDFVQREADGSFITGNWAFPRLNYENPKLREYLWKNMELYVRDFGVDGYRLDVGSLVPNDFWIEGAKRIRKINPNALMFNEGLSKGLTVGVGEFPVFDLNYSLDWHYALLAALDGEKPASHLFKSYMRTLNDLYSGVFGRCARYFDNHDTSHDRKENRGEKSWGEDGIECALVITHTIDGVPMVFNGCEVASECSADMYTTKFTPGMNGIDWQNTILPRGKRRMEFMKKINGIHHDNAPLWKGDTTFVTNGEDENLFAYIRSFEKERIIVVTNIGIASGEKIFDIKINSADCLLINNADYVIDEEGLKVQVQPKGYIILKASDIMYV